MVSPVHPCPHVGLGLKHGQPRQQRRQARRVGVRRQADRRVQQAECIEFPGNHLRRQPRQSGGPQPQPEQGRRAQLGRRVGGRGGSGGVLGFLAGEALGRHDARGEAHRAGGQRRQPPQFLVQPQIMHGRTTQRVGTAPGQDVEAAATRGVRHHHSMPGRRMARIRAPASNAPVKGASTPRSAKLVGW